MTYRAAWDDVEALIDVLGFHAERHDPEHYRRARFELSGEADPVKLAGLLVYLNKTCFNGNTPGAGRSPPRRTESLHRLSVQTATLPDPQGRPNRHLLLASLVSALNSRPRSCDRQAAHLWSSCRCSRSRCVVEAALS